MVDDTNSKDAVDKINFIKNIMKKVYLFNHSLFRVFIMVGFLGTLTGLTGIFIKFNPFQNILIYWMISALIIIVIGLFMFKSESGSFKSFWKGSTIELFHLFFPPLFTGVFLGIFFTFVYTPSISMMPLIISAWLILYGLSYISLEKIVLKKVHLLGWIFILSGFFIAYLTLKTSMISSDSLYSFNLLMAGTFGFYHFLFSAYLYFKEKPVQD